MTNNQTMHEQAKEQLRTVVERIERLEEEKASLAEDIKEVYLEAKSNGHDVKALRKVIALRKKDEHKRLEEEAILATYMHALGMLGDLADTPLGQASVKMIGHNSSGEQSLNDEVHSAILTEAARAEGAAAARDGGKISSSPYLSDSAPGRAWEMGYIGANVHAAA